MQPVVERGAFRATADIFPLPPFSGTIRVYKRARTTSRSSVASPSMRGAFWSLLSRP